MERREPNNEKGQGGIEAFATMYARMTAYKGPIPPPEVLEGYERIVPGSAKRIIDNALKQSEHRRALEQIVIKGDNRRADWGLYIGAAIASMMILCGSGLVALGFPGSGTAVATVSVVGLTSVFVYGSISRRREREHKSELMNRLDSQTASSTPSSAGNSHPVS